MGNSISSYSSPLLSDHNPSFHYLLPTPPYQVFINHRGKDTKQNIASLVFHSPENRGFKVFLDKMSIRVGEYIPQALICAIQSALVNVVILYPNYAQSEWCLDELHLISQTGALIIPVFWEIRPSNVRMENKDGAYAKALRKHKQCGKFDSRTLEKWENALRWVSLVEGFVSSEGEKEVMVEKITTCVAQFIRREEPAVVRANFVNI